MLCLCVKVGQQCCSCNLRAVLLLQVQLLQHWASGAACALSIPQALGVAALCLPIAYAAVTLITSLRNSGATATSAHSSSTPTRAAPAHSSEEHAREQVHAEAPAHRLQQAGSGSSDVSHHSTAAQKESQAAQEQAAQALAAARRQQAEAQQALQAQVRLEQEQASLQQAQEELARGQAELEASQALLRQDVHQVTAQLEKLLVQASDQARLDRLEEAMMLGGAGAIVQQQKQRSKLPRGEPGP